MQFVSLPVGGAFTCTQNAALHLSNATLFLLLERGFHDPLPAVFSCTKQFFMLFVAGIYWYCFNVFIKIVAHIVLPFTAICYSCCYLQSG